ncbi:PH domain-containing protein [Clostridium massiliamazoniense]|uniref:PH domain-containing protein n=1 Tax=Clostridium massiliamazoniense TaxID=1347366 RepID=UPI0006D81BC5|nr:PH domain-containing protein [Clostridium massiliamazoniense]
MKIIYWSGKINHFGLPLSFTTYEVSDDYLTIREGLLNLKESQTKLFKITDINLKMSLIDRLFGQGSLELFTTENNDPVVVLKNIKNPRDVRDLLNGCIKTSLATNKVTQTQVYSNDLDDTLH